MLEFTVDWTMGTAAATAREAENGSDFNFEFAALNLDDRCHISDCNPASEELFSYRRSELIGRPISALFPELSQAALLQNGEINPRLKFLSGLGRHFYGRNSAGKTIACKLFLNLLGNSRQTVVSIVIRPADSGVAAI